MVEEQNSSDQSSSRVAVVLFIFLIIFLSTASISMLIPSYNQISVDFNVPKGNILILESITILTQSILMVLWGYYTDRLDRNKVIYGGVMLSTIGFIYCSFSANFVNLCVGRLMAAAGLGFTIPISISILMDVTKEKSRSKWFGIITMFSSISNGVGQLLAAFVGPLQIIKSINGWQFPFLILSVVAVVCVTYLSTIKLPKMGAKEESLSDLQGYDEIEYGYHINKEEFKKILKKPTNKKLIGLGFFSIIPGTILIYTMILAFTDSEQGLLVGFPKEIKIQVATILAGLIGFGYILGGIILSIVGDELNAKNRKNRTRLAFVSTCIALPMCVLLIFMIHPVHYEDIGSPEKISSCVVEIFKNNPRYVIFLFCSIIGSFFAAGSVPNKKAVMTDVNLPEHRGTASSVYRLSEELGKSFTLMLISTLLMWFGSYRMMMLVGMMCWIPSAILWYSATKTVTNDMEEKAMILSERQQMTFIDEFFVLEIAIDSCLQTIQDAKDNLIKNPEKSLILVRSSLTKLEVLNVKSRNRTHLNDIESKTSNLIMNLMFFQNKLERILETHKSELDSLSVFTTKEIERGMGGELHEKLSTLYGYIHEMFEESDFGKIEMLYEDAYLKIVEARLRRNYDPFESLDFLNRALNIFSQVIRISEDRLIEEGILDLTDDQQEFQQRVADLLVMAKKAESNTGILRDKIKIIVETKIMKFGMGNHEFDKSINEILKISAEYGVKYSKLVEDTFGPDAALQILDANEEIESIYDNYDTWMREE